MDASSSSRFVNARAEESPSTVTDIVPEFEAEEVSTSWRSEYYSARCEAMVRNRGQFVDDIALEIEFSKPHRSEVSRLEVAPESAEEEKLDRENRELFMQLSIEYPHVFRHDLFRHYKLGRMIAKGGQGEIYELEGRLPFLLKVFDKGTSLRELRQSWPLPVLTEGIALQQCVVCAKILDDGRFAFVMGRFWGDLRELIDQAMQEKNVGGVQSPPFPYKWKVLKGWTFHPVDFMLGIAQHMQHLHEKGIPRRDLKASNVLLSSYFGIGGINVYETFEWITVADYCCGF